MSKRFAPINPGVGAAAPDADAPLPVQKPAHSGPGDATAPWPHDATDPDLTGPQGPAPAPLPGRSRTGRPAPRVTHAVALTVRVDPLEAADIDQWILQLRAETGLRLDKSEVLRELILTARHNPAVHRALIRRLR